MEYADEFDHVDKFFGTDHIIKDLSLKIPKGKITTILGFSGAGKSTLLKHILGLLRPTKGGIKVLDENLNAMTKMQLKNFRTNFGMLFQYAALFDSFSTFDNVAFPLREFTKKTESEIKDKVYGLLESVGLEEASYFKLPSALSGGMRKRVGLARALALTPSIMLYDEPTTGLDPITTHMVNELIDQTSKKVEGLTSIIISHDVRATLKISDYVAFLEKGKLIAYCPVEDFKHLDNPIIKQFIEL